MPRSLFYVWKAAYEREGTAGLVNKKPCAHAHPEATAAAIVDHILHLRRTYHLGPIRIVWYLERYHGIRVCDATVYRTLRRHGLNRLPTHDRPGAHAMRDAAGRVLVPPNPGRTRKRAAKGAPAHDRDLDQDRGRRGTTP
jgi:hypothetical protein